MKHTIVIVDDHLLIAKAIASIIDEFTNFEVLYECEHGKLLTEKFSFQHNIPEIVLLDISMPVMDGYETAKWIKKNHPEVLIMALTMQDGDEALTKMVQSGAKGYLHKNVHPVDLEKALLSLVQRGYYYPDWAASRIFSNLFNGGDKEYTDGIKLTDREREFLEYVCTELTYKEIAEKMLCSTRTVETFRDTLFEKLGVRTRVALALYAVKVGVYKV